MSLFPYFIKNKILVLFICQKMSIKLSWLIKVKICMSRLSGIINMDMEAFNFSVLC